MSPNDPLITNPKMMKKLEGLISPTNPIPEIGGDKLSTCQNHTDPARMISFQSIQIK